MVTSRPRCTLAGLILAGALTGGAFAQSQDPGEHAKVADSQEAFRILEQRRRDTSHPGDPLDVVGVFEGENDLRAGKGSLMRSTYQPAFVDQDEAYERQVAMLENREWSPRPLPRARHNGAQGPRDRRTSSKTRVADTTGSDPEDEGSSRGAWTLSLLAAAAAVGALVLQGRRMGA
ncbi:MAG: hypothetical protein AAGG01_09335 [Planctomycetota bacterium]